MEKEKKVAKTTTKKPIKKVSATEKVDAKVKEDKKEETQEVKFPMPKRPFGKEAKKKKFEDETTEIGIGETTEVALLKMSNLKKRSSKDKHIVRGIVHHTAPVLNVKNITKKFGSFTAVDKISFKVMKGERIGLIGANGAGKTTISEIIVGITKPTSGEIEFGFDFVDSPKEGIGMQFQQSTYPSGLTVKDIVSFARNLRKLEMTNEELKKLLSVFQMDEFFNRKVRSLSGGQRQKLNILLSIIHNPRLVILDELSTGLDISAREEIIQFTDKLLTKKEISAILISHHMSEIRALCSKVVVLDRGQVVDIKTIANIEKEHGSLENYSKKIIAESNKKQLQEAKMNNDGSKHRRKGVE